MHIPRANGAFNVLIDSAWSKNNFYKKLNNVQRIGFEFMKLYANEIGTAYT